MRRRRGIKRGNDERRSRTGDGSHCQPFPSSTSCTALQTYTNLTGHDHPKFPLQCQLLLLRSFLSRIYHPSIPNSSSLLCFSSLSSFPFIAPGKFFFTHSRHFCCSRNPPTPYPHSSWVLEDLSKPRGRKSTFLPHQLAKPNVEKARLKAIPLLMLTAIGNTPFA